MAVLNLCCQKRNNSKKTSAEDGSNHIGLRGCSRLLPWPLSVTFVNSCRQSASDSLINNFLTGPLSPCVDVRALCWICLGLSRTRVWVGMNDEIPQSQKQCMNPSQKKCHNMSHYPRVCGFKSVVFEAPIKGNHGENKAPVSLRTLLSWPSSSDISRKSPRPFMVMLPQRHGCTVVPWKNVPRESSVNLKLREIPWAINQNVDQFR